MDIDILAEKYDWQGFETYFYLFGALGTFSHIAASIKRSFQKLGAMKLLKE
jgi:hypothetical protein